MRVGRDDNRPVLMGLPDRLMLGQAEREIHQPVVNQVDLLAIHLEHAARIAELGRVRDGGVDASAEERLPREYELGIEVLLLGAIIDDRDAPQLGTAALPAPLAPEHLDNGGIEGVGALQVEALFDFGATGALRPGQHGVEECTAGVGVDFD